MNTTLRPRRDRLTAAIAVASAAVISSIASARDKDDHDEGRHEEHAANRVERGFELVPRGVTLNPVGRNRQLLGLGSYIVNTAGCNDCHTHPSYAPGGDPFQGQPEMINAAQYLSGGRVFGPFTAANITPDYAGRPAGLTLEAFLTVMRTGHDPKDPPGPPLQVMPWPSFGKQTEHDLRAIYEYLSAIPALANNHQPGP